ncbi:MAG: hypothetical protein ACKVOH_06325 [Chlamydiales bacterium]
MHFTREPIIETIVTAKEGYKLFLRNSQGSNEEFFVDMVEVITFGNTSFYRSMERPKCFIIPAAEYEIIEVRETRVALKTPVVEKGIKIAGGKKVEGEEESKVDKRRRRTRKRRGDKPEMEENVEKESLVAEAIPDEELERRKQRSTEKRSLIPPPSTLISETLTRYKQTEVKREEESITEENDQEIPL